MTSRINPLAGHHPPADQLLDVAQLLDNYYHQQPDPENPAQLVSFGTSGHRGSALNATFNEAHILAVTQAVVDYRQAQGITGPLY
ncbi:phosphoglucomutase, alpha-D-glucose phosphate-specific, partial [Synechocystis sp. LEGE 06083]|nr:phosphoglucomutase, alpha-D-glucose phosphate-specific [Synechocystis sp. LEGE 06083]